MGSPCSQNGDDQFGIVFSCITFYITDVHVLQGSRTTVLYISSTLKDSVLSNTQFPTRQINLRTSVPVISGLGEGSDDVMFPLSSALRVNRSSERLGTGNNSKAADSVSSKQARRLRIRRIREIPKKSVVNMVNAATTFERWLWMQPYNDLRPINEIPAGELDAYLVEFFANVKTESGSDFKYDSFQTLRSHLERFLKETGYPRSIINDHEFRNSQAVYKSRSAYLSLKHSNLK